jgi:hypothetical protein
MNRRDFLQLGVGLCLSSIAPRPAPAARTSTGEMPMRYKDWKTLCVGRYLVDVPENMILKYFNKFADGGKVEKMRGTPQDAKKMAENTIQELKATRHEKKGNSYIQSIPLANGGVLVQGWGFPFSTESTKAFLYIPIPTRNGPLICLYSQRILGSLERQTLQDLVAFGSSFKPLPQGSIPKEPGFCFDDVMIREVPTSLTEHCAVNIEDPDARGLFLSFGTEKTLSKLNFWTHVKGRAEEKCKRLQGDPKCDTLRFGRRDVGSIPGEEICLAGRTYDGRYRTFTFEWNNPGVVNSITSPYLNATLLDTGRSGDPWTHRADPIPFSTDAEALEVWDKFVGSIRIRPVG